MDLQNLNRTTRTREKRVRERPERRWEQRIAQAWEWADARASSHTDLQENCTSRQALDAHSEENLGILRPPSIPISLHTVSGNKGRNRSWSLRGFFFFFFSIYILIYEFREKERSIVFCLVLKEMSSGTREKEQLYFGSGFCIVLVTIYIK